MLRTGIAAVLLRATEDTILRLEVEFATDGSPSVARPKGERRMVAQIFPRWNRLAEWLSRVRHFGNAA